MESWRKAYGALKDSTKVGLAKVNSNFKDLDIAIVKATNHEECPPKERHVRKIFIAVSINRPRADVGYCIHALSRRLAKTKSWIVAVKSLIVVHRTIREGDPAFKDELMHYSRRGNLLQMSNFKDDSSSLAWDCSAWIRTYALFLEERVECFRNINFDIESDKTPKSPGMSKAHTKTRQLNGDELLEQLPQLQQLLYRLVCCQPEGAACRNFLIQYALALVVKESFKIYCAINDGIVNLVDGFFDMPKHEAVKALNIYKKAGRQADHLAGFYGFCKNLDLARTFQFPILTQPPATFLATMEEYIKEAPQTGSLSTKRLEYKEMKEEPQKPDEPAPIEVVEKKEEIVEVKPPKEEVAPLVSVEQPVDLLGLNEINPKGVELEESNALALAIIQPGNDPMSTSNALTEIGKTSGWELALVTAPSNTNKPQVAPATKMGGGFDNFLLNSLYEDDASRRKLQMQSAGYNTGYGYQTTPQNPYNQHDPFAMSSNIAPPTNVHVAMLTQQEQMLMQQQQLMMMQQQNMMMQQQQQNMMMMVPHTPYGAQYSQPQQMTQMGPLNPFDYTVGYPQSKPMQPHGNHRFI